jgi:hypothetical protein
MRRQRNVAWQSPGWIASRGHPHSQSLPHPTTQRITTICLLPVLPLSTAVWSSSFRSTLVVQSVCSWPCSLQLPRRRPLDAGIRERPNACHPLHVSWPFTDMSSQQVGASSSASLRPRNRRLISIEDDLDSISRSESPVRSSNGRASTTSLPDEGAPSPIPSAHPSRTNPRQRNTQPRAQNGSRTWGFQAPSTLTTNPLFTPGYWETSWSSIQGIASTLLGNDTNSSQSSGRAARKKSATHKPQFSISTPDEWGPAVAEQSLAYGSQEDRLARVQAKKREALLLANGHATPDSLGRHKRRTSVDQNTPSSPQLTSLLPEYTCIMFRRGIHSLESRFASTVRKQSYKRPIGCGPTTRFRSAT